jgi:ketosteroid isomerase-like protein
VTVAVRTNTEIVRAFFAAQYAGELETAFDQFVHPDFRFVTGSLGEDLRAAIPWAGFVHEGRSGYLELTHGLYGEFEVESFEPKRFDEVADRVYVEGHFRCRHRVTGRIADSDWLARFDFRAQRIVSGQFYENTLAVAAARQLQQKDTP